MMELRGVNQLLLIDIVATMAPPGKAMQCAIHHASRLSHEPGKRAIPVPSIYHRAARSARWQCICTYPIIHIFGAVAYQ
jgi:hypothetical protein